MGYRIAGIWTRKPELEWPTIQDMEQVHCWIDKHPYTIITMFAAEYSKAFGPAELEILKKSYSAGKFDMVMSFHKEWVQGPNVVQVPVPPKVAPVLKEGYVWQETPFGTRQVPAGTQYQHVIVVDMDDAVLHKIAAHVYEMIKAALDTEATKPS